jgi:AbrB family looped-hinge helix DNA binding protein
VPEKGQVLIPKEIREKLNIKLEDTIVFKMVDGRLIIDKIIERNMKDILKSMVILKKEKHIELPARLCLCFFLQIEPA